MITVETKNGVILYINVCNDVFPNEGGYFCEVYLNKDDEFEYDNFVIRNEDLICAESEAEFIQICCENYANNFDDMRILNNRFNKVYNSISDAYSLLSDFYTNHIYFKNGNTSVRDKIKEMKIKELLEKMGDIKEIAHDIILGISN
jgi:hypothetical protein